jgi:hypothetical protein
MSNIIELRNRIETPQEVNMSKGQKQLQKVLDQLKGELDLKKDFTIHPQDIRMNSKGVLVSRDRETLSHHVNDWATGQLATRTGIPVRYMRTMPNELRAVNVNHWLAQFDRDKQNSWLFRTYTSDTEGLVRGILSERFSPFDDYEFVEIINKFFGESNADVEIKWWHRDETGFHLRLVFNDLTTQVGTLEDGSPDVHKVGLHIENSEVGAKSIRITPLVWRLVCSNGMMGWGKNNDMEIFTQRHIYLKQHEMYGRVVEAIGNALKVGDTAIDKLLKAKQTKIEDPLEVIKKLSQKAKYSEKLTEKFQGTFMVESGNTAFHVIQAFTRGCQELPADQRVQVETDVNKFMEEMLKGA